MSTPSPVRIIETDGLGAELMPVVCAWCKAPMGAKVCVSAVRGMVSHGICPACFDRVQAPILLNDWVLA